MEKKPKNHLPPLKIPDDGFDRGRDLLGHAICLGSKRGIPDRLPQDPNTPVKLRLVKVRMVDYDYAPNGAYFGAVIGQSLYHAESVTMHPIVDQDITDTIRVFRRGANRQEAKERVTATLPNATFYR